MLSDPDFYGLTYDAYQMVTFEVEDHKSTKEEIKDENHTMEEMLYQQTIDDLENSVRDEGPVFPEGLEELPDLDFNINQEENIRKTEL